MRILACFIRLIRVIHGKVHLLLLLLVGSRFRHHIFSLICDRAQNELTTLFACSYPYTSELNIVRSSMTATHSSCPCVLPAGNSAPPPETGCYASMRMPARPISNPRGRRERFRWVLFLVVPTIARVVVVIK